MFEFVVTGIELESDKGELRLQGKFHPTYTSMLFLKLSPEALEGYNLGDKFLLTGAPSHGMAAMASPERQQHIVVDGEDIPFRTAIVHDDIAEGKDYSVFSDGSPLPDESSDITLQDREQGERHPPSPLGIEGDSLALGDIDISGRGM